MNIFDSLKRDHKEILDLLIKLQSTSKRATKARHKLFTQLKEISSLHSRLEESYFYSPLMRWQKVHDQISISMQQHESANQLLLELASQDMSEHEWDNKLETLRDRFRKHIEDEETTLFEEAKKLLDRQTSEELGRQMMEEKKEFVFEIQYSD